MIAVKGPVKSVDDLQGFKLRLAPSDLKFKVWEAVGTLPVTIAFGETYSAMASGLCDGMENEMPSILSAKFYEPAPYFTLTGHEITVRPLFVNAEKYNAMEPEMQQALAKAVAEATALQPASMKKKLGKPHRNRWLRNSAWNCMRLIKPRLWNGQSLCLRNSETRPDSMT